MALLKKQYIVYEDLTVLTMINRLCLKMAIKMTTAQKHEYKTVGYNNPRDPITSITAYFTRLDWFLVSLGNCGIAIRDAEKIMAAGAQMWQGKMFTEDQMMVWENKTDMSGALDLLHQKMAGMQIIPCNDGKTIRAPME